MFSSVPIVSDKYSRNFDLGLMRESRVTRAYSNRTATVLRPYFDRNRTEIVRVLKTYGNRMRTKNVRKSYVYLKRTEIVRVLKTYGNRTRTINVFKFY